MTTKRNKHVEYLLDISDYSFMKYQDFVEKYDNDDISFLSYFGIVTAIRTYYKTRKVDGQPKQDKGVYEKFKTPLSQRSFHFFLIYVFSQTYCVIL